MSSILAMSGYAQTIDTVPFVITKPGNYTLITDLTLSQTAQSTTAIFVKADNVVIDLRGFTLAGYNTGGNTTYGIANVNKLGIPKPITNLTIQGGTITGFDVAVQLGNAQFVVQNLSVLNDVFGVSATTCLFSSIRNCLIVSTLSPTNPVGQGGVDLFGCTGIVVKNNQIGNQSIGGLTQETGGTPSKGCSFIYNNFANCPTGLLLGSVDKYQGNVTTNCPTPFSGGTAVGTENN
jgi:hypothetical protein